MNETNLLFANLGHAEKTRSEMLKNRLLVVNYSFLIR